MTYRNFMTWPKYNTRAHILNSFPRQCVPHSRRQWRKLRGNCSKLKILHNPIQKPFSFMVLFSLLFLFYSIYLYLYLTNKTEQWTFDCIRNEMMYIRIVFKILVPVFAHTTNISWFSYMRTHNNIQNTQFKLNVWHLHLSLINALD